MKQEELEQLRDLLVKAINKLDDENTWGKAAAHLTTSLSYLKEKSICDSLRKPDKSKLIPKGAIVRLKGKIKTAEVLGNQLTSGNSIIEGGLFLSAPLDGIRYWHADDVEIVKLPG